MGFFEDLMGGSLGDVASQVASDYTPSTPTMADLISSAVGGGGDTNFGGYSISPDSYTTAGIDLSNSPASFMPGESGGMPGVAGGPLASILPDWLKQALGSETGKTVLSGLGLLAGGMNAYNQYQANQTMKDYYDQQRQLGLQKQAQSALVQAQNAAPINAPMTPGYADMVDLSNVDLSNYGRQKGSGGTYGLQFYSNPSARALGNINTISPAPRKAAKGGLMSLVKEDSTPVNPMQRGGQADNIHAMLSPGEYVMDADTVSALGDGDTDAGASRLDHMRVQVRKHKRGASANSIPPKAKTPLDYLKGAK